MSEITITNNSKSDVAITNEAKKSADLTWDEATFTWDEGSPDTWDTQRVHFTKDSKNSLSISNESK